MDLYTSQLPDTCAGALPKTGGSSTNMGYMYFDISDNIQKYQLSDIHVLKRFTITECMFPSFYICGINSISNNDRQS